jgi:hypothetical protein
MSHEPSTPAPGFAWRRPGRRATLRRRPGRWCPGGRSIGAAELGAVRIDDRDRKPVKVADRHTPPSERLLRRLALRRTREPKTSHFVNFDAAFRHPYGAFSSAGFGRIIDKKARLLRRCLVLAPRRARRDERVRGDFRSHPSAPQAPERLGTSGTRTRRVKTEVRP